MSTSSASRIFTLDIVRGFFVLLMVVSHTIFFIHTGSNPILNFINQFGNIICFTGLLLISGASAYSSYIHYEHTSTSVIKRLLKRLSWYVLGYYLLAGVGVYFSGTLNITSAISILSLQKLVPFTEFIIPFLVYGLLIIPFRPLYRIITTSPVFTVGVGSIIYIIAYLGSRFFVPEQLTYVKALLVGAEGWYSFPILHYFPVYIFGVFIGRLFYEEKSRDYLLKLTKLCVLLFMIVTAIIIISKEDFFILTQRFPPSTAFLTFGIACATLLMYISIKLHELRNYPYSRTLLLLLGQNTFAILFIHTLMLFIFASSGLPQVHSVILIALAGCISMGLALYGAKIIPFNYRIGHTLINLCECELTQCSHAQENRFIVQIKQTLRSVYALRTIFSVQVGRKRYSLFSGWTAILAGSFLFLTAVPLGVAENNTYFSSSIGALSGSANRTWFLTTRNEPLVYSIIIPDVNIAGQKDVSVVYQINTQEPKSLSEYENNRYSAAIPLNSLSPDRYEIVAIVRINDQEYKTQPTSFFITEPLIVTWTIDWEGYDVSNQYLAKMVEIADQYQIPMTHLFNPRIYTTNEISADRAEYLTNWVINRRDLQHEEIGLHLHMFLDYVKGAGVSPKTQPSWGHGHTNGYDILTSAYSSEEMDKMLSHAQELFKENGLGVPRTYRGGGWFINTETLKSLDRNGFLVDSSGRTEYTFGTQNVKGPWNLSSTTQPYHPSDTNQNGSNPPPRLTILEVPNNGADSYWFTSDEMIGRFTANYQGGSLLSAHKQVTFLSHPHWFNEKEQNTMREVFSYVDQYSYDDDRGPVVYGTLMDVYRTFNNTETPIP